MTTRPYIRADLDQLFALDELCFAPAFRFSKSAMRRFVETQRARTLVAEENGTVLAFAIIHIEQKGSTGYVVTLDVHPSHRRTGLARRIMTELEARAYREGARMMVLHVSTDNSTAIRFYESLGYTAAHTEEDFYGDDLHALVYRKPLGPPTRG